MHKNLLFKLGAPILALSLLVACGTADEEDPVENEAPMDQEEDNGGENQMQDDGMNDQNGNEDTPAEEIEDELDNNNDEETPENEMENNEE